MPCDHHQTDGFAKKTDQKYYSPKRFLFLTRALSLQVKIQILTYRERAFICLVCMLHSHTAFSAGTQIELVHVVSGARAC